MKAAENAAELVIYGDITADDGSRFSADDVCPSMIVRALNECKAVQRLDIYINSGGGDVFAGLAIYNRLKAHGAYKVVHIDGLAASIASVIALAGDEIIMPENAFMMIHKAWSLCIGNADDFREVADRLETIEGSLVGIYDENAAEEVGAEEIREKMSAETWLTAAEAAELFPKITIAEAVKAAACATDMCYNVTPESVEILEEWKERTDEQPSEVNSDKKTVENALIGLENIIKLERSMMDE